MIFRIYKIILSIMKICKSCLSMISAQCRPQGMNVSGPDYFDLAVAGAET